MTVPEIVRWVEQGEFLLTTGFPLRAHAEPDRLCRELSDLGLAGLGVKFDSYLGPSRTRCCQPPMSWTFPILSIPIDTRFDDMLSAGLRDHHQPAVRRARAVPTAAPAPSSSLTFSEAASRRSPASWPSSSAPGPRPSSTTRASCSPTRRRRGTGRLMPCRTAQPLDPGALEEGPGRSAAATSWCEPMRRRPSTTDTSWWSATGKSVGRRVPGDPAGRPGRHPRADARTRRYARSAAGSPPTCSRS